MTADEAVVELYQRHAVAWDRQRNRGLDQAGEFSWLGRFVDLAGADSRILDLGCGSGRPLAGFLIEHGLSVVGVDAAPALIAICRERFPESKWIVEDMRGLSLNRRFAGLLAWDSFFHLSHADQRAMFATFAAHALPGAALMFTSGVAHGTAIGNFEGEPLYHASLSAAEYRRLLERHGFELVEHRADDPDCGARTIWLARFGADPGAL